MLMPPDDDVCVVIEPGDGDTPKMPALTKLMILLSGHHPEPAMPPDGGVSKANLPRYVTVWPLRLDWKLVEAYGSSLLVFSPPIPKSMILSVWRDKEVTQQGKKSEFQNIHSAFMKLVPCSWL